MFNIPIKYIYTYNRNELFLNINLEKVYFQIQNTLNLLNKNDSKIKIFFHNNKKEDIRPSFLHRISSSNDFSLPTNNM
jgi:hypothetical protein